MVFQKVGIISQVHPCREKSQEPPVVFQSWLHYGNAVLVINVCTYYKVAWAIYGSRK